MEKSKGQEEKIYKTIESIRDKISDSEFVLMLNSLSNIVNQNGFKLIGELVSIVEKLKIQHYEDEEIFDFIKYYEELLPVIQDNLDEYSEFMQQTDDEARARLRWRYRTDNRIYGEQEFQKWKTIHKYPVFHDILANIQDNVTKSKYRFQWLERTDPDSVRTIMELARGDVDVGYTMGSSRVEEEAYEMHQREREKNNSLVVLSVKDLKGKIVAAGTAFIDEHADFIEVMRFKFSNYFENQKGKGSEYDKISIYSKFIEGIYAFQKEFNSQSPEEVYKRIIVRDKDLCVDTSELTPTNGSRVTAYGYEDYKIYDIKDIEALVKTRLEELRPEKTISPDKAASSLARKGIGKLSEGEREEGQRDKDLTGEE